MKPSNCMGFRSIISFSNSAALLSQAGDLAQVPFAHRVGVVGKGGLNQHGGVTQGGTCS
jgi:hypothetical protein